MKLHADKSSGQYSVTAYGPGFIAINGQSHRSSVILMPDRLDTAWPVADIASLDAQHLEPLAKLGCDVVLLGTGERQHFPPPAVMRPLIEARIGVEVMSTEAACRTYNILMAEGRKVVAALIVEAP